MTSNPAYGGDPVATLRRIAFLLERTLGDTRRIKAYRAAAAAALAAGPEAIIARAEAGTLQELPAIGASTAAVITDVLSGRTPEVLAGLEPTRGALAAGAQPLRSALRGDLHAHSDWSDGGSPIEEMAMTAVELGHDYLALTDHSPRLKVARGLTVERLQAQLKVVEAVNRHLAGGFTLLKGIEVDILSGGELDQTSHMLDQLDVVVASVHSELRMPRQAMTERMLGAISDPHTNVLGHCTGRLVTGGRGTRPQSEFDVERVFTACRDAGVAVEINSRPERVDPPDELLAVAVELGCLFSINSDAHAPGQLDFLDHGAARARAHGIDEHRIVTTWELPHLLEWTRLRR